MSNKKNLVKQWPLVESFFNSPKVRFESTVCAGTPVIATIRNLLDSLDEVQSIDGCLSGTLNFICSRLDDGIAMAKAVEDAHDFGYTEPDPRDDLNGQDVGRKALILARMAGWHLEMNDIAIEQLYPPDLGEVTKEDFFHRLFMLTPKYQQLAHHAAAEAMSLRYIASVTSKGGRCYMKAVSRDSEFGLLKGPANKVSIHSRVHSQIPLTISGSGAGADVTALGLLSDILALAEKIVD
jgi:homoserine dehydrogenase